MQLNNVQSIRRMLSTAIVVLIFQSGFTQLIYINAGKEIYSFDPLTCEYTFVVKTSHGFLDLAFDRNGVLYGCGTDLERINTVTGGLTKLAELNTAANGMTISADDIVYLGASDGELISYNLMTGVTTFLGNMGFGCAGDLTFYGGELYMAAFNNEFVKVNITHPDQSEWLFTHQSQSDIVGIISDYVNCEITKVYALSGDHTEIFLIDFASLTLDPVCQLTIDVYGGASTSEFLSSVPVTLGMPDIVQIDCDASEGSIAFPKASGFGSLQFRLNHGAWQNESFFNMLMPGMYMLELMDERGCRDSTNITILNENSILLENIEITPTPCGQAEGTLSFSASGGNGLLLFSLTGILYQSEMQFAGLPAGNYHLTIKDEAGCMITQEIEIPELSFEAHVDYDVINPTCHQSNGVIMLFPDPDDDFEYAMAGSSFEKETQFDQLNEGSYIILVRDINLCIDSISIALEGSLAPELQLVSISPASCGSLNGKIEVAGAGGSPPFSYSIDAFPHQAAPAFDMVAAGEHIIYVMDIEGCLDSIKAEIPVVIGPVIKSIESIPSACYTSTGKIQVSWESTMGSDSLQVFDPMQHLVANLDQLAAGEYYIVLTDASGCLVDTIVQVLTMDCSSGLPNIFSPNGDGINDNFVISNYPDQELNCEIFDRWGNLVFVSTNENHSQEWSWNGKHNGKDCPSGVYAFVLRKINAERKISFTYGNITLIR